MKASTSDDLKHTFARIRGYSPRFGVQTVRDFIATNDLPVICGVIGLRRTGKTTILWQTMATLPDAEMRRAVYLEMEPNDNIDDLTYALDRYSKENFRYFFIDEITNLHDFSRRGATLANTYAAKGLQIVVSGTDSLLINISSQGSLFNRIRKVKTTWMPWREYASITSRHANRDDNPPSFDCYLEDGGIIYNDMAERETALSYIRTSIIDNFIHSLDNDDDGRNYEELGYLRETRRLKDFILRVINDNTHRFIINLLTKRFRIQEFESAKSMTRAQYPCLPTKATDAIFEALKSKLGYIDWKPGENLPEQDEIMAVNRWLQLMDVFVQHPVMPHSEKAIPEYLLTQPALRWHQVLNVIDEILKYPQFIDALEKPANDVKEELTSALRGEILEDIVIADAINTLADSDIFSWRFQAGYEDRRGEFDMVIARKPDRNPDNACDIFEIKSTSESDWEQTRHLRHQPYLDYFRKRVNVPRYRCVLYRGDEYLDFDDIMYLNVERFLMELPDYHEMIAQRFESLAKNRDAYDHMMASWIKDNVGIAKLTGMIERYAERPLVYQEMPFADWLRQEGAAIPAQAGYTGGDAPGEIDQLEVGGCRLSWSALQRAVAQYDQIPEKNGFVEWLQGEYGELATAAAKFQEPEKEAPKEVTPEETETATPSP